MDGSRFDQLMRDWFASGTRRTLLQRLTALPLAAGLAAELGTDDGEAKKRNKHGHHHNNKPNNKHKKKCTKAGGTPKPRKPCCNGLTRNQIGQCQGAQPSPPPPGPPSPPPPTPGCSGSNPCPTGQLCEAGTCAACDVCATGCTFNTIQAAIDDPSQLATIRVCAGTYNEDLTIGRSLTLRGAGDGNTADDTIVDGSGPASVVTVTTGTVVLQRLRITGGDLAAPDNGGGVNSSGDADLTLDRCTVIGNSIPGDTNYGGGIYNTSGATLHMTNCTVTGNDNENGYGVGVANNGVATIDSCTISGNGLNSTGDPYGGGIYNGSGADLTVTNCTINDNFSYYGGGLYNDGGTMNVSGTTIRGNDCDDSEGGGIYNASGSVTVSHCTIQNNTGADYGGGISSYDILSVSDTEFSGHTVETEGGGLYATGTELNLTNCTITNNTATNNDSGGAYVSVTSGTITGCQITGNNAPRGGGLYNAFNLDVFNSTITNNQATTDDGGGIYNAWVLTLTATTVTGNTAGGNGDDVLNTHNLMCVSGDEVGDCVDDGGIGCNTCA